MMICLFLAREPPVGQGLLIHEVSRSHTTTHHTVGRTPLDEWSAHRRDLYLTTHNRQTSMPRWDSNPQSQQASGRRPTSQTARKLESTIMTMTTKIYVVRGRNMSTFRKACCHCGVTFQDRYVFGFKCFYSTNTFPDLFQTTFWT
jgi:hypothetical protein